MHASTYYFHINTKILADFQICISVPLKSTKDQRLRQQIWVNSSSSYSKKLIECNVLALSSSELTLSWRRSLSNRNQSFVLRSKSMDLAGYNRDLLHERVKYELSCLNHFIPLISFCTHLQTSERKFFDVSEGIFEDVFFTSCATWSLVSYQAVFRLNFTQSRLKWATS